MADGIKGGIISSRKQKKQEEHVTDDDFLSSLGATLPEEKEEVVEEPVIVEPKNEKKEEVKVDQETGEVFLPMDEEGELRKRKRRRRRGFHDTYSQFTSYIDKRLIPAWIALLEEAEDETQTDLFNEAISMLFLKYQRVLMEQHDINVHKLPLYPLPRKRLY